MSFDHLRGTYFEENAELLGSACAPLVLPVVAVWQASSSLGHTGTLKGKVVTGLLALVASALVTAAYHAAAGGSLRAFLLGYKMLIYSGLEHLHGLVLILMLAALVLALNHYAGGYVGDAYGGFRLVYVLSARAA